MAISCIYSRIGASFSTYRSTRSSTLKVGSWIQKVHYTSETSSIKQKVVQLTPPLFNRTTIFQKSICSRHATQEQLHIGRRQIRSQEIIYCYSNTKTASSLFPGIVAVTMRRFEASPPDKKEPIRVVGSGLIGLSCAIELAHKGYKVAGITTKELVDIPSYSAESIFVPLPITDDISEENVLSTLLCVNHFSFEAYTHIHRRAHPYISAAAVRQIPFYSNRAHTGLDDLESYNLLPKKSQVTLDFGNGAVHQDFRSYTTYFVNTTTIMRDLHNEVARMKIPIEPGSIKFFCDLKEKIVFDCAGFGREKCNFARDLGLDVRHHLVSFNSEAGRNHMDYMLYAEVDQFGKKESLSLLPKDTFVSSSNLKGVKCNGVLHGTFYPHENILSDEQLKNLDEIEFHRLEDRFSTFFYGKPLF